MGRIRWPADLDGATLGAVGQLDADRPPDAARKLDRRSSPAMLAVRRNGSLHVVAVILARHCAPRAPSRRRGAKASMVETGGDGSGRSRSGRSNP